MLLTNDGAVMSWGNNSLGQCGHSFDLYQNTWCHPERMSLSGVLVVQISCGFDYSLLLSHQGRVFSFGDRGNGELGHADFFRMKKGPQGYPKPKPITSLDRARIVQVNAGGHSLAVSEDGELYSWGWMANGAPCRGPKDISYRGGAPPCIPAPHVPGKVDVPGQVAKAYAGFDHGMIVTTDGRLFTYGRGDYGELGHGYRNSSYRKALRVSALEHVTVTDAAAGQFFSVALTDEGEVYTFGQGYYGKLGHGDAFPDSHDSEGACMQPLRVEGLPPVEEIAVGATHALARLRDGTVRAWGCNDAGQLGLGLPCNEARHGVPEAVQFPDSDTEGDQEDEDDQSSGDVEDENDVGDESDSDGVESGGD
jgi:alpha-tubulin suppressor-like RCC1 family protein